MADLFEIRANCWLTPCWQKLTCWNFVIKWHHHHHSVRAAKVSSFSSVGVRQASLQYTTSLLTVSQSQSTRVCDAETLCVHCTVDGLGRLTANWMISSCFINHCRCSNLICHSEETKPLIHLFRKVNAPCFKFQINVQNCVQLVFHIICRI